MASLAAPIKHVTNEYNIAIESLRAFIAHKRRSVGVFHDRRYYAGQATAVRPESETANGERTQLARPPLSGVAKQKEADRQFYVDLLNSAATKRDAKAFIARLQKPSKPAQAGTASSKPPEPRVTLDGLFGKTRAVDESPIFTQYATERARAVEEQTTIHVALVQIANLSRISDEILSGIAQTLSQLARLSMAPCVVIDESPVEPPEKWRNIVSEQADRLVTAIEATDEIGARILNSVLSAGQNGTTRVFQRKMLLRPIQRGKIPVIVPIAYSEDSQTAVNISANEAMLALTRELAVVDFQQTPGQDHHQAEVEHRLLQKQVSVERVIVIDEAGGPPNLRYPDQNHVFINLQQEYHPLQEELRSSNDKRVSPTHATNLKMVRAALKVLPASASGLITTPIDTANSSRNETQQPTSVGTRRQKNPLIYNLLTDKPAYSASLPSGRLAKTPGEDVSPTAGTTFVKHGMPLNILPNPDAQEWTPEKRPWIKLTDPRIDLDRLVYLINDSFNRQLDVDAYLERVNNRIAGVIIAGEYEGGAILTWESPPGTDINNNKHLVPYLDKFAVLKKAQGAGGVADILFNAMVRTCFPNGVCWRSRKNNPVNKWYFERSRGTWKIPDMNWTMFWTTPGVTASMDDKTFLDYEAVSRGVKPTWLDDKKVED